MIAWKVVTPLIFIVAFYILFFIGKRAPVTGYGKEKYNKKTSLFFRCFFFNLCLFD